MAKTVRQSIPSLYVMFKNRPANLHTAPIQWYKEANLFTPHLYITVKNRPASLPPANGRDKTARLHPVSNGYRQARQSTHRPSQW